MRYEYMHTSECGSSDAIFKAIKQPPGENWELMQMAVAGDKSTSLVFLWRRLLDEAIGDKASTLEP